MPNHRSPGDTSAKGYGAQHQRLRAQWAPIVAAGGALCAKCGQTIRPGERWDLGHVPGSGKRMYQGPEHRECNRSTANERRSANPAPRPTTRW